MEKGIRFKIIEFFLENSIRKYLLVIVNLEMVSGVLFI